jgi:hypothetical protein
MNGRNIIIIITILVITGVIIYLSCVRSSNTPLKRRRVNDHGNLLPLSNPALSLREAGKQLTLLEDHLNNERKRCKDCITKHCAAAEAFCDEAITLDLSGQYRGFYQYPNKIRGIFDEYLYGEDPHNCAQKFRSMRKHLLNAYNVGI